MATTPTKAKPPTKPETHPMRMRAFYCDDPTWDAAMAKAEEDGLAMAEVLRHYLREYTGYRPEVT